MWHKRYAVESNLFAGHCFIRFTYITSMVIVCMQEASLPVDCIEQRVYAIDGIVLCNKQIYIFVDAIVPNSQFTAAEKGNQILNKTKDKARILNAQCYIRWLLPDFPSMSLLDFQHVPYFVQPKKICKQKHNKKKINVKLNSSSRQYESYRK